MAGRPLELTSPRQAIKSWWGEELQRSSLNTVKSRCCFLGFFQFKPSSVCSSWCCTFHLLTLCCRLSLGVLLDKTNTNTTPAVSQLPRCRTLRSIIHSFNSRYRKFSDHDMRPFIVSSSLLLFFSSLILPGTSLEALSNSPCAVQCGNVLSSTSGGDIVCQDGDFASTTAGQTFQSCISCQLGSNYVDPVSRQTDLQWALCE